MPSDNTLIVVIGDDELLVSRAVEEALAPGTRIEAFEVGKVTAAALGSALDPQLVFEPRAVLVPGAQDIGDVLVPKNPTLEKRERDKLVKERFARLTRGLDSYTRLVLTAKGNTSALVALVNGVGGEVIRIKKLANDRDRMAFVRNEVRSRGGRITDGAARVLINASQGDLRRMATGVSQLMSDHEGTLSEDVVSAFFSAMPEVTGFAVADAVFSGDLASALGQLRGALRAGTKDVLIANALITTARDMSRAFAVNARNAPELAAALSMPDWKAEKTLRKLRGWDQKSLALALEASVLSDQLVKGGARDSGEALERTVRAIASARTN